MALYAQISLLAYVGSLGSAVRISNHASLWQTSTDALHQTYTVNYTVRSSTLQSDAHEKATCLQAKCEQYKIAFNNLNSACALEECTSCLMCQQRRREIEELKQFSKSYSMPQFSRKSTPIRQSVSPSYGSRVSHSSINNRLPSYAHGKVMCLQAKCDQYRVTFNNLNSACALEECTSCLMCQQRRREIEQLKQFSRSRLNQQSLRRPQQTQQFSQSLGSRRSPQVPSIQQVPKKGYAERFGAWLGSGAAKSAKGMSYAMRNPVTTLVGGGAYLAGSGVHYAGKVKEGAKSLPGSMARGYTNAKNSMKQSYTKFGNDVSSAYRAGKGIQ